MEPFFSVRQPLTTNLNLSVPEELQNSIFEIPIIPQNFIINN